MPSQIISAANGICSHPGPDRIADHDAISLEEDEVFRARVRPSREVSLFEFAVGPTDIVTLDIWGLSDDLDLCASVLDASGTPAVTASNVRRNRRLTLRDRPPGEYELAIWSNSGKSADFLVRMKNTSQEQGRNLRAGRHLVAKLQDQEDVNKFTFRGSAGERMSLIVHDFDDADGVLNPIVDIVGKNRFLNRDSAEERFSFQGTYSFNCPLPFTGEYSVLVRDKLGNPGTYFICLETVSDLLSPNSRANAETQRYDMGGGAIPMFAALFSPAGSEESRENTATVSKGGESDIAVVVLTARNGTEQVVRLRSGEMSAIKGGQGQATYGMTASVSWKPEAQVEIKIVEEKVGPERALREVDHFNLKVHDKHAIELAGFKSVELADLVPRGPSGDKGNGGYGGFGGAGGCCVTCGAITVCACSVSLSCGACYDPACGGGSHRRIVEH